MATLHDLLGVHPDADNETLRWAFRQTLEASRPDPNAGDADPFLQSAVSTGILQDPKQRMIYCKLIEWERERLQSKSKRAAVVNTITASLAVLLGTIAGGYGLLASSAPTAVVATAMDDGSSSTADVKTGDDISPAPAAARKDEVLVAAAPAIKGGVDASSDTMKADAPPTSGAAAMAKADDASPPVAEPARKANDAPAHTAEPMKKVDDAPVPAPAPVKKVDDVPAPEAAPAKTTDEVPAVPPQPVKKTDDTLTVAATTKQAERPSTPAGRPAETAAVQSASRADSKGPEGPDAKARPSVSAAIANGGDKVAFGFRANETAFRNNAKYYRERGIVSYRRGDFLQATADLGEAIRLDRADAQAFNIRGNVADEMGAFERALDDYDEAIRLDSNNAAPFDDRAILWRRKGDADKALLDLDRAVRSGFADAKTYCDRGLIWYEKGSFGLATADFHQAIKLDAVFSAPYLRRGALLHRNSEFNVAFTAVYPAIRVDPKIFDVSRRVTRRPVPQPTVSPPSGPEAPPEPRAGRTDARTAPADLP